MMEQQFGYGALVFAIMTSFIASWLFFYYLRFREKRIRKKIEQLKNEEKFLNQLSKGNIKLLRTSFRAIFFILFLILAAMTLLQIVELLQLPDIIKSNIIMVTVSIFGAAAIISFEFFLSISKINNLNEVNKKIQEKKEALEDQLS